MITIKHSGSDFSNTLNFFKRSSEAAKNYNLNRYGKEGCAALSSATPIDTGATANSWSYTIKKTKTGQTLTFNNSNVNAGVNIAIIIQYGHGFKNGAWVQGRDYINPALRPIFDKISKDIRKEITK